MMRFSSMSPCIYCLTKMMTTYILAQEEEKKHLAAASLAWNLQSKYKDMFPQLAAALSKPASSSQTQDEQVSSANDLGAKLQKATLAGS